MSQYVLNTPLIVNSTSSGIVVPRLTTAQKIAASSTAGMVVFDTDIQDFEFYNGYTWVGTGYSYTGPLFSSNTVDGFGRIRVSNPFTLFDSSNQYRNNEKFSYNYYGAGATGSFDATTSVQSLTVSGSNTSVIAEAKRVCSYQPGKSLLVMCSFAPNETIVSGVTQRVGYFTATNGVYFQIDGPTASVNVLDNGVTTSVLQSNWNQDMLNGSGPSGITADWTKAQLLYICIEWLGVGTVEVGFVANQQFIPVHKFWGMNSYTTTYMQSANLPVRYELFTSSSPSTGTLKQICSTVISEGGYQGTSTKNYFNLWDQTVNTKSVSSTTVWTPIFSMSLNTGCLNAIVIPSQVDLFLTTNGTIQYKLALNGVLSGASWTGAAYDSSVVVDYSATSITFNGNTKILDMNFVTSSNQAKSILSSSASDFNFQLGRSLSGLNTYTSDVLTVCAVSLGGTTSVTGDIGWWEIGMM